MIPRLHDWRAIVGVPMLIAGSLASSRRFADVLLVAGATLLATAVATPGGATPSGATRAAPVAQRQAGRARWAHRTRCRPSRKSLVLSGAALCCAGGAGALLIAARSPSHISQVTYGSANPTVTGGRGVPASPDAQLHIVPPGAQFILGAARVTVSRAQICVGNGSTLIAVPVSLAAATKGKPTDPPAFELVDARLDPHDPATIAIPARPRGTVAHAAPPPPVLREQVEFRLRSLPSGGALRLDAENPSGVGPIYRVVVSASPTFPPSGGSATCPHPGGAA
jgi:hypothetical protein